MRLYSRGPAYAVPLAILFVMAIFHSLLPHPQPHQDSESGQMKAVVGERSSSAGLVKFVLIASQRTGSSLLCRMFSAANGSACLGEVVLFHQRHERAANGDESGLRITTDWNLYEKLLNMSLNPYTPNLPHGGENSDEVMLRKTRDEVKTRFNAWSSDVRVVGFKLMHNQMFQDTDRLFDYFEENNVRIIHLQRKSALDSFASSQAALKTGEWHGQVTTEASNDVQIEADVDAVLGALVTREQSINLVRNHIAKRKGLAYTEVYYEEFAGEHAAREFARLAGFLSLRTDAFSVQQVLNAVAGEMRPIASLPCKDRFIDWPSLRNKLIAAGHSQQVEVCESTTHPALNTAVVQ